MGKQGRSTRFPLPVILTANVPGYGHRRSTTLTPTAARNLLSRLSMKIFNLDITDYAAVNFDSLADVIDVMGGIDLEVTEEERYQINAYLLEGEPLRESGMVHLNGPQAVSYARIRK